MLTTVYNISISASGLANANASAGFVDLKKVEQYMAANNNVSPISLATSTNKVRANIRFKNIQEQIQLMGNSYFSNTVTTGGTTDTAPSAISFNIECERGDEILYTNDELNAGVVLTNTAAIARCVARGLMQARTGYEYPVYDPTLSTSASNGGTSNTAARVGSTTIIFDVGALVSTLSDGANAVTITKLV